MNKIKIKILKDFRASADGVNSQEFKAGEILELGTLRLTFDLFNWFMRNTGFGELYKEKSMANAPENKALKFESFSIKDSEEMDREIIGSTESEEGIVNKKNRGKK